MNDLLTAESILFGIIIAFFGSWYPKIKSFTDKGISKHLDDRKPDYNEATCILNTKLRPLSVMLTIISLIFIPDTIKFIIQSIKILKLNGLKQYFYLYDAVITAYVYFCILILVLTLYVYYLLRKVKKIKRQNSP